MPQFRERGGIVGSVGDFKIAKMKYCGIQGEYLGDHAQMAGTYALLTCGPVEASYEMIEVYRRAVGDNCDRISAE
jgi:hypothetical protein